MRSQTYTLLRLQTNKNYLFSFRDLYFDDEKLDTYIDNVLMPMAEALSQKQALGGWEIANEPEGSVHNDQFDTEDCFDTTVLVI